MKRLVSLLLAAVLAAALAVPALAAEPTPGLANFTAGDTPSYYDVESSYWFSDYVEQVAAYGLMTGRGERQFDAWDTITGMEAVALTARIVST